MRRVVFILSLIFISVAVFGCMNNQPCDLNPTLPVQIDDGNEPAPFPYVADSAWPMSHRNPYCQASSPYAGPEEGPLCVNFLSGDPVLITMAISAPYSDGRRVVWGNSSNAVFKMDPEGSIISFIEELDKGNALEVDTAISGAYTLIDSEGIFYAPDLTGIIAYGDKIPGDPDSAIEIKRTYQIPGAQLHGADDVIVGLNMTYDGMLAIATSMGTVGVISRDFSSASYLYLGENEEISNSIACDENNKIYVVTSERMYAVKWTGSLLTTDESAGGWSAEYETGDGESGIRLGKGSGSTPTLMGTGSQDKFIVVTDGQDLMHLVLFWRDEIPADWTQISGTKDRRIAAQVPVTFGDPSATASLSEQSVCVRGYGALVVNNQMGKDFGGQAINVLMSGNADIAPYGAEKFEWNAATRQFPSAWVNKTISLPNGIPTMSSTTNLIYDIGQRNSQWTMEALDWNTGESVFYQLLGSNPQFNSAYAATEIGHSGGLYTGTAFGMLRLLP